MRFPVIKVLPAGRAFEALAAIRVAAMLNSALLVDSFYGTGESGDLPGASRIDPRQLQHAREALLGGLSGWSDTTLEIRISVVPDLVHKSQGVIDLTVLLRCQADDADSARERVAARYLALMPFLSAHVPEADFRPVTDPAELESSLAPLAARHAYAVRRKREPLFLGTPLRAPSVGFAPAAAAPAEETPPVIEHLFPWLPSFDDWGRLLDTMTGQLDPLLLVVRLSPAACAEAEAEGLTESLGRCEAFLAGLDAAQLTFAHQVQLLRNLYVHRLDALRGPVFRVGVLLFAEHALDPSLPGVVGQAVTRLPQGRGAEAFFQGGFTAAEVPAAAAASGDFFPEDSLYSLAEAACAFRFPSPPCRDIPGLAAKRFRTSLAQLPAALAERPGAIRLFLNEHLGHAQPVSIDLDDRMRHCFIVGQTGTGKSTLMESMILQDIRAGRGVAVIDPHGDMVDGVLQRLPAERAEDVILFDFLDRERPLGFNLIAWRDLSERDLIIDELYRVLDHIYDMRLTGGPIFEMHFRNGLKLLMGDKVREGFVPTILEFVKVYLDERFRHWLLGTTEDRQVKDFLEEAEAASGEASWRNLSPYVTSKFSRYVNDTTLRRIVGQARSTIDFEGIMNRGKIFLVKLGKGRFGSQVSALLANMMVLRFKMAAMQRGELPREKRTDFFLYIDEAHNLPPEHFTEMFAEMRKYRLGLVLATQYCSQLGNVSGMGGNDLLSAIFGNVGTQVFFRTGAHDSAHLVKGLIPHFGELDILSLPNFHGYARMSLGGDALPPFSFRTELDPTPKNPNLAAKIRHLSRLRYGQDANLVDYEISRRDRLARQGGTAGEREEVRPIPEPPNFVNFSVRELEIGALELPDRIRSRLAEAGLGTVGDLLRRSERQLIEAVNLNLPSLGRVVDALYSLGCRLPEKGVDELAADSDHQQDLFGAAREESWEGEE